MQLGHINTWTDNKEVKRKAQCIMESQSAAWALIAKPNYTCKIYQKGTSKAQSYNPNCEQTAQEPPIILLPCLCQYPNCWIWGHMKAFQRAFKTIIESYKSLATFKVINIRTVSLREDVSFVKMKEITPKYLFNVHVDGYVLVKNDSKILHCYWRPS